MSSARNRVEVLHGVNLDVLDRRDPDIYGGLSLTELEVKIRRLGPRAGPGAALLPDQLRAASSASTCTGCPSSPTPQSSTPAPGPTTAARSGTPWRSRGRRPSRSTSPTSRPASPGARSPSLTGSCSRRSPARAPTAIGRRWSCSPASSGRADARSRRSARGAGRRARPRPAARHPSDQRPLSDRVRGHERRLPCAAPTGASS